MNIKKKFIVLLASGIMAFSVSPFVLAATPAPAGNDIQAQQDSDTQSAAQGQQAQVTIAPASANANTAAETLNSKYLTKGGAAFWFVFTAVFNAVLSFWIGNRFYKMSKKDNHIAGELRALRKDVEEKFVKSVGGFSEQEIDINNLNESLAMDDEGIKMAEHRSVYREISAEEEERFRKWEEAQISAHTKRTVKPDKIKSAVSEELEDDLEDVRKIRRKNYQPKRDMSSNDLDAEEDSKEEFDQTQEVKIKGDGVKSKAKEILGDIFPFKED